MKSKAYRILFRCWLFVVFYTIFVAIGIEFMPRCDMRLWNVRSLMFQSLGWCLLAHPVIVLGFLILRKWLMSFLSLGLLLLLFFVTLIVGLTVGPPIETVHAKVADTVGIPSSELVCVGGFLSRESEVLFRREGSTPFAGKCEEVPADAQACEIVMRVLERMNVKMDKAAPIKILKFPWEFDTIYCVICGKDQWMVFFGMCVM